MLLNLTDKTTWAYDKIDDLIIDLKGNFLNLCADIDRYFDVTFNVQLTEKTPIVIDEKFIKIFPNLKDITEIQFEQLIRLFVKIRNLNAHLFLNIKLDIPNELQEFFDKFPKPEFSIMNNGYLTIFGMIYVLSFLSQKYQLTSFLFEVLRNKYFHKIVKQEKSEITARLQTYFYSLCGKGKPLFNSTEDFNNLDHQAFNASCRLYLTKIFFSIEKCILKWTLTSKTEPQFNYLLQKNLPFSKNIPLSTKLLRLRNNWLHGKSLNDEVDDKGYKYTFTLKSIVYTLKDLKSTLADLEDYRLVVDLIKEFGEKLYAFYFLRLVEISYKILDSTLFMEDKIEDRLQSSIKAVERIKQAPLQFFELAEKLVENSPVTYTINAGRFGDKLPRVFETDNLKILKITSNSPIKLGDYQTDLTEMHFALVNVDSNNLNLINGISPYDLKGEKTQSFSSKISIYSVKLD